MARHTAPRPAAPRKLNQPGVSRRRDARAPVRRAPLSL